MTLQMVGEAFLDRENSYVLMRLLPSPVISTILEVYGPERRERNILELIRREPTVSLHFPGARIDAASGDYFVDAVVMQRSAILAFIIDYFSPQEPQRPYP